MTRPAARHINRRAFKLKPPPSGTFARTLWSILRTGNDNREKAARRLNVTPGELSGIIRGHRSITSAYVQEKDWRQILARYYPQGWQTHAARFEAHARDLKHRGGRQAQIPIDRDSFGYVLWKILGGPAIDMPLAAQRLQLPSYRLSAIIHNHIPLSQRFATSRHWDRVLAEHYAHAWAAYRDAFFTRLEALAAYPGIHAGRAEPPKDRKSFGYALWLVLGGESMDRERAAALLKISSQALSCFVHGDKKPTQRLLTQKRWRAVLAEHYPDRWRDYRQLFENRAARLKLYRGEKGAPPEAADKLTAILRMITGNETPDLEKAARLLRVRPAMLRKILDGRTRIQPRFIRNKRWAQILAENYPVQWQRHCHAFLAAIEELERPLKMRRRPSHSAGGAATPAAQTQP
jgi:hypothetical protein